MPDLLDSLLPGSFNGVPFLIEDSNIVSGRKTVVHEFPNQDKRFVEDLGYLNEVITIQGCVPTEAYFSGRDGLKRALETRGYGQLLHPFYGMRKAVCTQYTIKEDTKELGYVKFNMVFTVGQELNFAASGQQTFGDIFQAVEIMFSAITDVMTANFTFEADYSRKSPYIINSMEDLLTYVDQANTQYTVRSTFLPDKEASFKDWFLAYERNISLYLFNPTQYISATITLFNKLDAITRDGKTGLDIARRLGQYQFSDSTDNMSTDSLAHQYVNRMRSLVELTALVGSFGLTARNYSVASFNNVTALTEADAILEEQYQNIIGKLDNIDLPLNDLADAVDSVRSKSSSYTSKRELKLPTLTEVDGREQPLTVLTYMLYGSVDNVEMLRELNKTTQPDPALLSGDVTVVTSA